MDIVVEQVLFGALMNMGENCSPGSRLDRPIGFAHDQPEASGPVGATASNTLSIASAYQWKA